MDPLRWRVAGCTLAYSTAADGDLREAGAREAWLGRIGCPRCAVPGRQVHGTAVVEPGPGAGPGDCDALVTADPGLGLGVYGADCPGLVLIAPDALGAAHCGWRGTAAGLAGILAGALDRRSRHPRCTWTAVVGPGIGPERYEVDGPVTGARAWPPGSLLPGRDADHPRLDLAAALEADCRAAGVGTVLRTGVCTAGDPRLHSYRWQGRGLVQLFAAWRG